MNHIISKKRPSICGNAGHCSKKIIALKINDINFFVNYLLHVGPFTPTTPISKVRWPKCLNILIENTENMIIITHLGHIKINDNFVLTCSRVAQNA